MGLSLPRSNLLGQLVVVLFIGFVILIFVQLLLTPGPLVSVSNFSWMVAILVNRHVPILDNGETGLMDLGSETSTDPWSNWLASIGTFSIGPGISQRAAAARTQGPWRGLVACILD